MPIYDATPDSSSNGDARLLSSRSSTPQPVSGRSSPTMVFNPYYTGRPRTPQGVYKNIPVDRQEIIRRIKSRDDRSRPSSPELERQPHGQNVRIADEAHGQTVEMERHPQDQDIGTERQAHDQLGSQEELGLDIARPRSALHKGDFRDEGEEIEAGQTVLSTSPPAPWHMGFPAAAFRQAWSDRRTLVSRLHTPRPTRSRATSTQFIYKPPTSPLVNQSRPDTPPVAMPRAISPDKQTRRHTYSPQALQNFVSDLNYSPISKPPSLRKEQTFPYQAHQPRRSLHSLNPTSSSPASPSRRPSVSSEAHSPLQHAPMVGSYEESILRGRMSTTPSKPLDFIAQIGVLGRGDCKASLRCPPHVVVPFPAVFYSYGTGHRPTTDQPSPYVGLIDLEHNLPAAETPDRRQRYSALQTEEANETSTSRLRKIQKAKRGSAFPKTPSGGCYRIPQQGQIQIVIKNPNKTAVKLFLVPYDVSDMAPGQKTFIRQRSYSAGPIIDMPLSTRKNLGTDRPEASLSNSEDPNDRPVLRYLIHLHIVCTGRGRFWLYKSVRVVFANRVPDGKEKLRNEIQLPEPRYSTYKHIVPSQTSSPFYSRADERAIPALPLLPARHLSGGSLPTHEFADRANRPFSFPFQAPLLPTVESRPSSRHDNDAMEVDSDTTRSEVDPLSPRATFERPISPASPLRGLDQPFSFARDHSRERDGHRNNGASLLSQRLRGLGM